MWRRIIRDPSGETSSAYRRSVPFSTVACAPIGAWQPPPSAASTARSAVTAERAVLATLGGGCQVPIGAHALVHDSEVALRAVVVSPDGSKLIRKNAAGPSAAAADLGRSLGHELLSAGASSILAAVYNGTEPPVTEPPVTEPRP